MPSITFWNRLEPRPRSPHFQRSLAAQVRDPLWFLTQQWQFGEFRAEDAASPAYVHFAASFSSIDAWRPSRGGASHGLDRGTPLEAAVESEPFTPDAATAVELGQRFEALLAEAGLADALRRALERAFRDAYPLPRPSAAELDAMPDPELAAFLRVCGGRAIDGAALYQALRDSRPNLPAALALADAAQRDAARGLIEPFLSWVRATFGDLGLEDAPAWRPERLEYGVRVSAPLPAGGRADFEAHPGRDGEFEWYAFDQRPAGPAPAAPRREVARTRAVSRSLLPTSLRFRGMPNARWWQFEDATTDFASIQLETRELAKLLLVDFMLVHSDDWFVVPFAQDVGTLCRVEQLLVHDVFGDVTVVDRVDLGSPPGPERWTMFSTSVEGEEGALADFFVLPATSDATALEGKVLEEVRFLRDEMANAVWAVEHTTQDGLGRPRPGHERDQAGQAEGPPPAAPATRLEYRVRSRVPEHWIPFLPVRVDGQTRAVALERAAALDAQGDPILPASRILRPSGLADPAVYQVREEEVTRTGTRVSRLARRSRWTDGSTHLWLARRKRAGAGEGSSGLRFDQATPRDR